MPGRGSAESLADAQLRAMFGDEAVSRAYGGKVNWKPIAITVAVIAVAAVAGGAGYWIYKKRKDDKAGPVI